ncbi:hypothetical protein RFI_00916, partial [Reticulomyxa filosa]
VDNHINFSKYLKFYHAFKDVIRLTRYHLHSNRNDPKLVEEINAKVYNEDATVNPVLNVQSEEEKHDPLKNFFSNQTNEENKEKEANPAIVQTNTSNLSANFFASIAVDPKMQSEIEMDLDLFQMLEQRIVKVLTIQANKIDESEKTALDEAKKQNRRTEHRTSGHNILSLFKS